VNRVAAVLAEHTLRASDQVEVIGITETVVGKLRRALVDVHDLFRGTDRGLPQDHGVDDAEDRRSGADAQRQGDNRGECEPRTRQQPAEGIAHVVSQASHRSISPPPRGQRNVRDRRCAHGLGQQASGRPFTAELGDQLLDRPSRGQAILEVRHQLLEYLVPPRPVQLRAGQQRADRPGSLLGQTPTSGPVGQLQRVEPCRPHGHPSARRAPTTPRPAMAATRRRHCDCCDLRTWIPLGVTP